MTAFDHEQMERRRRQQQWDSLQDCDDARQTKIATFLLSLAVMSQDLLRLRAEFTLINGTGNGPQNMTEVSLRAKDALDAMEFRIRRHSIDTFGRDIFLPQKIESVRALSSPESPEFG